MQSGTARGATGRRIAEGDSAVSRRGLRPWIQRPAQSVLLVSAANGIAPVVRAATLRVAWKNPPGDKTLRRLLQLLQGKTARSAIGRGIAGGDSAVSRRSLRLWTHRPAQSSIAPVVRAATLCVA